MANLKLAIQLGLLASLNIITAFLFQWYILIEVGPGGGTDAYFASLALPQLVLAVVSGSLMQVLVPLLAGESEVRLRHDTWAFILLIGGLFSVLAAILWLTASWWVTLIVPGFNDESRALAVEISRIQLIAMALSAINAVQFASYHARQKFFRVELILFIAGAIALAIAALSVPRFGIVAAAWAGAVRVAAQTLLLGLGIGMVVVPDLKSPIVSQAWSRIRPLLMGTAYYKTDPLIDRALLSTSITGTISLYYLAQQLFSAVTQVLGKAFASPLMPHLSTLHKSNDWVLFRTTYYKNLLSVFLICVVGVLVLLLFGQSALSLLIGHGKVGAEDVVKLWWIMIWLCGVFVAGSMGQVSTASFYAMGNTTTSTKIAVLTFTLYIPGKFYAFSEFGVRGLALATSFYVLTNLLFQVICLERIFRRKLVSSEGR